MATCTAFAVAAVATLLAATARTQHGAAAAPAADAPPSGSFVVRCGTLLLGDGSAPLRDAWLVVQDGKVRSAGTDAPPPELPVVDASARVVMPGIVAVDSDLAATPDAEYQFTPDALALDQFDFERTWISALQGGVTTAYLSPGRQRLVSGQGAVVKLAGTDLVARVLADSNCLRIEFGDAALQAPRVFEPTAHPTDDDPLVPARVQTPTGRISVLAELRAAFANATDAVAAPGGLGAVENRYDEQPLADVVAGKLPLRAGAFTASDIRRALLLQQELGVRMVLENAQHIEDVAALAAAQQVPATFRVPVRFGRSEPGGEDRRAKTPEPRADAPAKAAAAGLTIGLAPAPGVPLRDYLMAVAVAVRHGLEPARALRAIGADAAAILGVQDRVGTLAPGKDADFLVLSGEPLAIGTLVEQTWIDGARAWQRTSTRRALAVRAGRVHDGLGRTFRNGVVLIQDGVVKGVGEELSIPFGAEVVDVPDAVVTPGFVDAFSHLGLAGDGTPVPAGAPNQRLHDAIAHDDEMFRDALAEGITTVLVSGKDGGPVSGRIAAIKTGARSHAAMTVRAIAGLRLVHDTIGPDAIKPIADQLNRGKQYVETWRKYEQELEAWQRGDQKPAPAPAPAAAPADKKPDDAPPPPPPDPVTGTWEAELSIQGQVRLTVVFELQHDAGKVTGQVRVSFGGRDTPAQEITAGSFANKVLKLEFRGMGGGGAPTTLEATLDGDTMTGKVTLPRIGDQELTGKRTAKTAKPGGARRAPAAAADDSGRPKAPKVDEALEPWRAAIEKRAPLVVHTDRGAAIRDVVALLDKEGVPFVLHGADDVLDDPALLQGKKPPVIVGPETVVEADGVLRNVPATFVDHGLPVLFGSGECAGARHLPLHAAYAVRYGLSPADALAGLTSATASAFRLDDRIGALAKGRDADLVVFSGNPFEPQSRVVLVVCNGEIVVDRREGQR